MTAAGLIFSNIHDQSTPELTRVRTMASVPFGGRYRLIDFALSNMVNSGITKVGLITHYNYQSLLDHIGTGKDWDLARRSGGIKILPPYITAYDNAAGQKLYASRLEALMGARDFITRCTEDCFVLSDCDIICNIDLNAVIEDHAKSGADVTFVTKCVDVTDMLISEQVGVISADADRNVTDFVMTKPTGEVNLYTNIMVVSRNYMMNVLADSVAHGYTSFFRDIISHSIGKANYRIYEYDGWYAYIGSLESYFACSMQLLTDEARNGLFYVKNRPILTKVRNSAPTKYSDGANVKNSLVADGCVIEGTVENSILFRGVKVGKGTVVKNSILMQDTYTGSDVSLNCVITDKNAVIRDGRTLSGHESLPFFIGKNGSV
ncbi:MAG: glucose-1-phosphate adenylyltransferase subunit GlgD [Clostridia bacterium]|nr:glucose-1-phosphate adenylyltransferase subunit GlgD [Clostridia bacterium]